MVIWLFLKEFTLSDCLIMLDKCYLLQSFILFRYGNILLQKYKNNKNKEQKLLNTFFDELRNKFYTTLVK